MDRDLMPGDSRSHIVDASNNPSLSVSEEEWHVISSMYPLPTRHEPQTDRRVPESPLLMRRSASIIVRNTPYSGNRSKLTNVPAGEKVLKLKKRKNEPEIMPTERIKSEIRDPSQTLNEICLPSGPFRLSPIQNIGTGFNSQFVPQLSYVPSIQASPSVTSPVWALMHHLNNGFRQIPFVINPFYQRVGPPSLVHPFYSNYANQLHHQHLPTISQPSQASIFTSTESRPNLPNFDLSNLFQSLSLNRDTERRHPPSVRPPTPRPLQNFPYFYSNAAQFSGIPSNHFYQQVMDNPLTYAPPFLPNQTTLRDLQFAQAFMRANHDN